MAGMGDCIDCRKCVQVCPTGIDIRQGLQMECIACSNCIDACDSVMDKLLRPRGLVRYGSQNAFAGKATQWFRPRLLLYGILLGLGATAFACAASNLQSAVVSVTRLPGVPYVLQEGKIRNNYYVRILNKRHEDRTFAVRVEAGGLVLEQYGFEEAVHVPAEGELAMPLVLVTPRDAFSGNTDVRVTVVSGDGATVLTKRIPFLGPEF